MTPSRDNDTNKSPDYVYHVIEVKSPQPMSINFELSVQKQYAKPFVKWAGGKQSLANTLCSYFPEFSGTFFEPFLGGGSIFLTLRPERSILGDANEWLICTYKMIKKDWVKVAKILDSLENTKEQFLYYRKKSQTLSDDYERAAYFIYLNKTCFRGLFRVNKSGHFNVPYGEYERRYYDPENLEQLSKILKKATIKCSDFESLVSSAKKGDFVYFDPPYYKLGGYSDFNRYTSDRFNESEHKRLLKLCKILDCNDVMWAVSNSDTQFVRDLYKNFKQIGINARREINLNSKSRNINELLIVNY